MESHPYKAELLESLPPAAALGYKLESLPAGHTALTTVQGALLGTLYRLVY